MNIDKAFYEQLPDGVYAKMETSKGDMIIQFFDKEAPVTVANFVGLAQGTIENKTENRFHSNMNCMILIYKNSTKNLKFIKMLLWENLRN